MISQSEHGADESDAASCELCFLRLVWGFGNFMTPILGETETLEIETLVCGRYRVRSTLCSGATPMGIDAGCTTQFTERGRDASFMKPSLFRFLC